jgi:hypothetical protein
MPGDKPCPFIFQVLCLDKGGLAPTISEHKDTKSQATQVVSNTEKYSLFSFFLWLQKRKGQGDEKYLAKEEKN